MRFANGSNSFYNGFYLLPASRLFADMQLWTTVLSIWRNARHPFSLQILPLGWLLKLCFNQLVNLPLPCVSSGQLSHQESLEILLIQGFSEISLDRGQLWSENLRQENKRHSSSEYINHHELSQATPTGLGFPCQRWVTDKLPMAHREQKVWPKTARGWVFSKK